MAVPTWVTGQVLAASDVNNWFVPIASYKAALLARSTTTLSNDPELFVPLVASAVYDVRYMFINTGSGVGFKWTFTFPAGSTGGYGVSTQAPGTFGQVWGDTVTSGTTGATVYAVIGEGTIFTSGTSGNLQLQWAANAAGTMTIGAGSKLVAYRVG